VVDEIFDVLEDLFERRSKAKRKKDKKGAGEPAPQPAAGPGPAPARPAGVIFCLACGTRNNATDRFCQDCGDLLPSAGEEMRCPACNRQVPLTARFCGGCGTRVAPASDPSLR
jgi:predicted amidophosphoribosyltransferase